MAKYGTSTSASIQPRSFHSIKSRLTSQGGVSIRSKNGLVNQKSLARFNACLDNDLEIVLVFEY
jgi:hypothetical protein